MDPNKAKANGSNSTGFKAKVENQRVTGYQKMRSGDKKGGLVPPINKSYSHSNATELRAAKLTEGRTLSPSVQALMRKKP